jgi:hypothetical protein
MLAKDAQIAIIANHRSIRAVAFEEFSGHCRKRYPDVRSEKAGKACLFTLSHNYAFRKGVNAIYSDLVNMCPKRCHFVDRFMMDFTVARVWKRQYFL